MNRQLSEDGSLQTTRLKKKGWAPQALQIGTTARYHRVPIREAKMRKTDDAKGCRDVRTCERVCVSVCKRGTVAAALSAVCFY